MHKLDSERVIKGVKEVSHVVKYRDDFLMDRNGNFKRFLRRQSGVFGQRLFDEHEMNLEVKETDQIGVKEVRLSVLLAEDPTALKEKIEAMQETIQRQREVIEKLREALKDVSALADEIPTPHEPDEREWMTD